MIRKSEHGSNGTGAQNLQELSRALSDRARSVVERLGARAPIALVAASVLFNGLAIITPGALLELVDLARDLGASPTMRTYHGEAPLFFAIAHLVGAVTIPRYLAFCVLTNLAAFAVFMLAARRAVGRTEATLAFGLLVAHPITYTLQTWIGLGDGLAVACTAVLLFARTPLVLAMAAVVGASSHPSVLFGGVALLFLRAASAPVSLSWPAVVAGVAGLLIGRIGCALLPPLIGYEVGSRWQYISEVSLTQWAIMNAKNWSIVLYSLGFAVWLPVLALFAYAIETRRRVFALFGIWLVCSYAIAFFTKDTSRVYAMLTWGPTVHCLLYGWTLSATQATPRESMFRISVVLTASFGWCVPHLWTGGGVIAAPWLLDLALQIRSLILM